MISPNRYKAAIHTQDLYVVVRKLEQHYFTVGELSDVHRCQLGKTDCKVAVKVLRGISLDGDDQHEFEEEFENLVRQLKNLNHPNVMQCFGLSTQFGTIPGFVLPYCHNGPILEFLKTSDADRVSLLIQVTKAVHYLHTAKFVHGDIRASNILIKSDGTPVLMDGGLYTITSRASHITTASICKPCRWMAPEVLDPPEELVEGTGGSIYTCQSDIYSLGMTILEVLTEKPPFSNRRYDTVVILEVIRGIQPHRPEAISDDIWRLMKNCWETSPESRPSASRVEKWLKVIGQMESSRRSTSTT